MLVEREQIALILQEDHALARRLERQLLVLLVVGRDREIRLRTIEPAEANSGLQDVANFLVDGRLGDAAVGNRRQ